MATAPKVSVGLGTKLGLAATVVSAGLSAAVASGASLGVGAQTMAILSVVSALVTAAGRMVQSGWNTAPAVETEAGTIVPNGPPVAVAPPSGAAKQMLDLALPTDAEEAAAPPPA